MLGLSKRTIEFVNLTLSFLCYPFFIPKLDVTYVRTFYVTTCYVMTFRDFMVPKSIPTVRCEAQSILDPGGVSPEHLGPASNIRLRKFNADFDF